MVNTSVESVGSYKQIDMAVAKRMGSIKWYMKILKWSNHVYFLLNYIPSFTVFRRIIWEAFEVKDPLPDLSVLSVLVLRPGRVISVCARLVSY